MCGYVILRITMLQSTFARKFTGKIYTVKDSPHLAVLHVQWWWLRACQGPSHTIYVCHSTIVRIWVAFMWSAFLCEGPPICLGRIYCRLPIHLFADKIRRKPQTLAQHTTYTGRACVQWDCDKPMQDHTHASVDVTLKTMSTMRFTHCMRYIE